MKIVGKRDQRLRLAIGDPEIRRAICGASQPIKATSMSPAAALLRPSSASTSPESAVMRSPREFGVPPGMQDRVVTLWKRADIPPPNTRKACSVLEVTLPTDFLC